MWVREKASKFSSKIWRMGLFLWAFHWRNSNWTNVNFTCPDSANKINSMVKLLSLKPWLNGCILLVEIAHIGHQISNHIQMWQRIDFHGFVHIGIDATDACQCICACDIHGARATNALTTRPTERQCGINFIFDFQQCVQHHRCTVIQIDLVFLQMGFLAGLLWIPAIDLERLQTWLLLWLSLSSGRTDTGRIIERANL